MPAKTRVTAAVITAAALIGLAVIGYLTKDNHNDNLLFAKPLSENQMGIDEAVLKNKLEDKFPITYECSQDGVISAINKTKSAEIVAVNYLYKSVMPYPILSGGFFTEDHQKRAASAAVLNEKAAFDLFGGYTVSGGQIKVNGETYTVVGVIRDGIEDILRVYIPITCTNLKPNAFMIRLDEDKGVSEEYVINECKQAGITDAKYDFIALGARAGRVEFMFTFAVFIIAGVCLVSILRYLFILLGRLISRIRMESKQYYTFTLLLRKSHYFLSVLFLAALSACCCAGLLWLLVQVVNGFLRYDGLKFFVMYTSTVFSERISFLSNQGIYSDTLFILFLAGLVFWLMTARKAN